MKWNKGKVPKEDFYWLRLDDPTSPEHNPKIFQISPEDEFGPKWEWYGPLFPPTKDDILDEDQYDYWCCPNCGWDSANAETDSSGQWADLVKVSEMRYAYHIALEYGGEPYLWMETWKCPRCYTI